MELQLPQIPHKMPTRDKKGRIIAGRGHIPANKGKKWGEYNVPEESRKKILANLSNEGRRLGGLAPKNRNQKRVVGIKDKKFFCDFDCAGDAATSLRNAGITINVSNIRACCRGNRPSAGGIKWFYENDFEKWHNEIV